jgi:hypothetical protein
MNFGIDIGNVLPDDLSSKCELFARNLSTGVDRSISNLPAQRFYGWIFSRGLTDGSGS